MARIVCLANSFKRSGRCIAGIDLVANRWIRPIGDGHEGAIGEERLINGAEPELLDIIDVPVGPLAIDHDCQPENIVLGSGAWHKVGEMTRDDVLRFTENEPRYLLHNRSDRVALSEFQNNIPREQWKSLQLIRVQDAVFEENPWEKIECRFRYGRVSYSLKTTFPNDKDFLDYRGDVLLTVSMGGPYRRNPEDEFYCWKMIAGAIKLV